MSGMGKDRLGFADRRGKWANIWRAREERFESCQIRLLAYCASEKKATQPIIWARWILICVWRQEVRLFPEESADGRWGPQLGNRPDNYVAAAPPTTLPHTVLLGH